MSERLANSPERNHGDDPELQKRQQEALKELHEKARTAEHEHQKNLERIRENAEHQATPAEKTKAELAPDKRETDRPMYINGELKDMSYRRTLKRTRNRLPVALRPFSSFIHLPVVEAVSEIGAKTVARPSGILAGGMVAFLGSSIVLWISRHYGYEYNFLLFALLFVGGFFVGLLVELIVRLIRRKQ